MLTESYSSGFEKFSAEDVKQFSTRKRSHLDGVTYIDVLSQYNAYVSSGYDCCVYVWSISEHRRLGALLLGLFLLLAGGDRNWELKVSEDVRKKNELDTANKGLKEVEQEKHKRSQEEKEKRKYNEKDETINHAANLIKKVDHSEQFKKYSKGVSSNKTDSVDDYSLFGKSRGSQSIDGDESTERELKEDYYEMNAED